MIFLTHKNLGGNQQLLYKNILFRTVIDNMYIHI